MSVTNGYNPSSFYQRLKRFLDVLFAVVGLIVMIPVFVVIAACIKLEDGGNVLYCREMVGLHGRRFVILKFRTMIPHADEFLEKHPQLMQEYQKNMKLKRDPRVTRVGRFLRKSCLDELPQLFNVLVGDMSFVGPRAIHERELSLYGKYAEKRHLVRPGITGLWQVSANRHKNYEERIPLDMQYVNACSFLLDLRILLKTVKTLLTFSGV